MLTPSPGGLAPPPTGNPGSAPGEVPCLWRIYQRLIPTDQSSLRLQEVKLQIKLVASHPLYFSSCQLVASLTQRQQQWQKQQILTF